MERLPITIIGGGLAGLTLGIALRQHAAPVVVIEAKHYPRHRVCGEFISGLGQQTLERLGLKAGLFAVGANLVRTALFYEPHQVALNLTLSPPAWGISRYTLDNFLAETLRALGGELRENERWRNGYTDEGIMRATGRKVQPTVHGWRWIGLKVHARQVALEADLEMHLVPQGYVGLCRLHDAVNICGLFRSRAPLPQMRSLWPTLLRGTPGSELYRRLDQAIFEQNSFCAVAGLDLTPQPALGQSECALGDALTMIAPVSGNGMSLAFESAELAVDPLARYSQGQLSWAQARQQIAQACDRRFHSRLRLTARLHRLLFRPLIRRLVFSLLRHSPTWTELAFTQTRS